MFHPRGKNIPPLDNMRGLIAEHVVASTLNLVSLEKEELFVFHSVGLKNEDGETDHIILYGSQIFVIETKNRAGLESVSLTARGNGVGRNLQKRFKISTNNIHKKVQRYSQEYPQHKVQGLLVVHFATKETSSALPDCEVVSISKLFDKLSKMLTPLDKTIDNKLVVKDFASLCIRNEAIH